VRKIDKIRVLENQLEHERKRAAAAERNFRGAMEYLQAMDAVIYAFAEKFGEPEKNDAGECTGWLLTIPAPRVKNIEDGEQVRAAPAGENWHIHVRAAKKAPEPAKEAAET